MENLTTLKNLLGITDDNKDVILQFILDKTEEYICNYCAIDEVPQGLNNTLISMAIDTYRAESFGQEKQEGTIKSITEGDVSVSFGSFYSNNPSAEFLENYKAQLDVFRKARW